MKTIKLFLHFFAFLVALPIAFSQPTIRWRPEIIFKPPTTFMVPSLTCPMSDRPNRCSRFTTESVLRGSSGKKTTLQLTGSGASGPGYDSSTCTPDDSLPNGSSSFLTRFSKFEDLESISVFFSVANATDADPCPSSSKLVYQIRRAHTAVPLQTRNFELMSHYHNSCNYKSTITGADLGLLLQQLPDDNSFEFYGELCAAEGGNRWGQQFMMVFGASALDAASEDFRFEGSLSPANYRDLPLPLTEP